jgi:ABC-type sugar transport system ATPase subunit
MASVRIDDVTLRRSDVTVLDGVSLDVFDGELIVILGASGAGKSMMLRVVAGLETAERGRVFIGEEDVTAKEPSNRNIAMVFQENVLFPFMNVRRNVSFPLEIQHLPDDEVEARVMAEARVLEIQDLLERMPARLSAGHQQLVQTARALVRAPDLFLMDEPLARLDAHYRVVMRREIRLLQSGYRVTTMYVTNDPDEAMAVADRVAVIDRGRIQQVGAPLEVYRRPASRPVAAILGNPPMTFVVGRVVPDAPGFWVEAGPLRLRAWDPLLAAAGDTVDVGLRPEHVVESGSGVSGAVVQAENLGPSSVLSIEVAPGVAVPLRSDLPRRIGERVEVRLVGGHVFARSDGRALGHVEPQ